MDHVKWLGYRKIVLKTDNEPAILKLLQESLRDLRVEGLDQVMAEISPEYDPQSNGNAEVGVELVKGMVRTMRSGLERELGFRVPARHPLVSWIVRHAANTLTWTVEGHDGKSDQRVRGKPFRTKLLTFHQPRDVEVVFKEKKEAEDLDLKNKIAVARQVYIKASDLLEYGLTRGCPKCEHELSYGAGRTSKPHSQRCKACIMG